MSRTVRIARAVTTDVKSPKAGKPRRHLVIQAETDFVVGPPCKPGPEGWLETYKGIEKMRAEGGPAPVDVMGCSSLHDPNGDPQTSRFQILVALMLSAMTKDAVTAAAFNKLHASLPGGLTVASVAAASQETIEKLIIPVGFFRRKAGYLIATAGVLQDKYHGDIPPTLKELCALPGVGPKMGHLCMQVAWGKVMGIGVDVHMHRIFNRLGWCNTKTPEQTRMSLEEWLPLEYWDKINKLVVGFGQTRCSAIKPKCGDCLVRDRCPFGRSQLGGAKSNQIKQELKRKPIKQEKTIKHEKPIKQEKPIQLEKLVKLEKPVKQENQLQYEQLIKQEEPARIKANDASRDQIVSVNPVPEQAKHRSKKKRTITELTAKTNHKMASRMKPETIEVGSVKQKGVTTKRARKGEDVLVAGLMGSEGSRITKVKQESVD